MGAAPRRSRTTLLVAGALTTLSAPALAQPAAYPLRLDVGRSPDSASCPDAPQTFAALRAMLPTIPVESVSTQDPATIVVSIAIRPAGDGHEAALTFSGARRGERTLVERDPECRGLADAIAVAVALIVDPAAASASMAAREGSSRGVASLLGPEPPATARIVNAPSPAASVRRRAASISALRLGVEGAALRRRMTGGAASCDTHPPERRG